MQIINEIKSFRETFYPEPQRIPDYNEFKKVVIARTAIDEIIRIALLNHNDILSNLTRYREQLYESYCSLKAKIEITNEVEEIVLIFTEVFRQLKNWILHRDVDEPFYDI